MKYKFLPNTFVMFAVSKQVFTALPEVAKTNRAFMFIYYVFTQIRA